jgi:hypothetical protein
MSYQDGDGYVECDECGHAIETHTPKGCSRCPCVERWTRDKIRAARREAGLVSHFYKPNF